VAKYLLTYNREIIMVKFFQHLKVRQGLAFILSLVILLAVIEELGVTETLSSVNNDNKKIVSASVVTAQHVNNLPKIALPATVEPIKLSQITSQVSGKITNISTALRPGRTLIKNQLLLTIDPIPYHVAVAEANAGLITAKMQLKKMRIQFSKNSLAIEQARSQWTLAQSQLIHAQEQLKQTKITLPYDAEITNIHAYLGEYITPGQKIISVLPKANKHINVRVNEQAFAHLSPLALGQLITLVSLDKQQQWPSKIVSISQHTNNLQRNIYLEPIKAQSPMYGQHITALFPIKGWPKTLSLPESALTLKGELWWLNNDEQAYKIKLDDYLLANNNVYFPQAGLNKQSIKSDNHRALLFPLASLSQGMKIQPLITSENE